ncbi:MAG: hypothetical protein WCC60_15510 [Ilumatobacteraceae bacterium]
MTDGVRHSFNLFADYFQFYLQDDDRAAGVDGDAWTPEAMTARVANGERFVAIGAARNLEVPAPSSWPIARRRSTLAHHTSWKPTWSCREAAWWLPDAPTSSSAPPDFQSRSAATECGLPTD